MRIVSYNILEGGFGKKGERLDQIIDLVKDLSPDILGIAEAKGWGNAGQKTLYRVEQALGMRGFLGGSTTGFNTAIFIKPPLHPIRFESDTQNFYHGMSWLTFEKPNSAPWNAAVVHLDPFSPDARRIETSHLVARVRAKGRTLIMGDFNSPSAFDVDKGIVNKKTMEDLPARYRLRYGWWEADGSALANVERAGFVDLYRRLEEEDPGYTVPTEMGNNEGGMRLDYIFASDDIAQKATACTIVKNKISALASDHYPLMADIDF